MATKPEESEPLELTEELEPEQEAEERPEGEEQREPDDEEEETVVSFGDDEIEADQEDDNSVIRQLRSELREARKKIRESDKPQEPEIDIGEKPTLAACDYDEEKFEAELADWHERKKQADEIKVRREDEQKAVTESWAQAKQKYDEKVREHGFEDHQDAQDAVDQALGQLSPVILKAANDPALIVYALGKSPAKLAELAKIKDPFELAAAIARMEGGVKVVKKRKGPNIDAPQRGSAPVNAEPNKELDRLQKEADRTGDRTKLIAYKKQQKAKA